MIIIILIIPNLAILSVISPSEIEPLAPITPGIVVKNQGTFYEPIAPVKLKIFMQDSLLSNSTGQCLNLEPEEIDTIFF